MPRALARLFNWLSGIAEAVRSLRDPTRAAAERRLQAKRQHSQHKQTRRRVDMDE
jgi:hypothetical protein